MIFSRVNRSRQDYWFYLDQLNVEEIEINQSTSSSSSTSSFSSSSFSSSSSYSSSSSNSSSSISSSSSSSSSSYLKNLSSSSSNSSSSSSSSSSGGSAGISESSSSSSSSSSSYGYCNVTIGAEGFSIAAYNGTYTQTEDIHDDRPCWLNENGKYIFYTNGGDFWCMAGSISGLTVYRSTLNNIWCPYNTTCANWETWPGGGDAGVVCIYEMSSSSSSSSSSS